MSPDGKWLASATVGVAPSYFTLFDIDGKRLRTLELAMPSFWWLPDSSGVFIALDAPQRAPSLGIVDVNGGGPRNTGLQMGGATLSRDGKTIVANHQDGCCVAIEQRQIWVAPRAGGPSKVLVTTSTDKTQPIGVVGVDQKTVSSTTI
jgi:hypothetical protein